MNDEIKSKIFDETCEFLENITNKYDLNMDELNSMILSLVIHQFKHCECPPEEFDGIIEEMKRVYRQKEGINNE